MAAIIPTQIRNEAAYEAAIRARIIANARKTWERNTPKALEIDAFLNCARDQKDIYSGVTYAEGFLGSVAEALDTYGKLSEKQVAAVLRMMEKRAEKKAEFAAKIAEERANSRHVGEVGKRQVFTLTCVHILEFGSEYGVLYVNLLKDQDGNSIVYKGGKCLLDKGETGTFKATVKSHGDYKGQAQTIISRPADYKP